MDKFVIQGQKPLNGIVSVSGSKNAALPILAASILTDENVTLTQMPELSDVSIMCEILSSLGCSITRDEADRLTISSNHLRKTQITYDLAGKLRGSFLVMGPLLARCGHVKISMPGGCPIGARPIDLHLKGLSALGAKIKNTRGSIEASAAALHGAKVYLDFPSVGATENIMSVAALADGMTIIENAAVEPEIVDLANFLCSMGAHIAGAGTDTVKISGVPSLHSTEYGIIPDRIEAGTLLAAAAVTNGEVTVTNILPDYVKPITAKLSEMGIPLDIADNAITVKSSGRFRAVDIKTLPFPGFPTDMQAQMTSLLSVAEGTGIITETIFENRFMHTAELCRMGASIRVAGRSAVVEGKKTLNGTKVKATDLRAGAALVIAGLAAKGTTEISDIYHIERGYDGLEKKLQSLGADICRRPEG